jgi:hypothetical protein
MRLDASEGKTERSSQGLQYAICHLNHLPSNPHQTSKILGRRGQDRTHAMYIGPLPRIHLQHAINQISHSLTVCTPTWVIIPRVKDSHRDRPALFRRLGIFERRVRISESEECTPEGLGKVSEWKERKGRGRGEVPICRLFRLGWFQSSRQRALERGKPLCFVRPRCPR